MYNKLLVVGANSYLASEFVKLFSEKFLSIDGIINKNQDRIHKGIYRHLYKVNSIDELIVDYDVIVIFSAYIPYSNLNTPNVLLNKVNIGLILKIANKFTNSKIIFCSSISVYGVHSKTINEYSTFNSPSLYGLSKLAGEAIMKNINNYVIIRFSSIYGPHMNTNSFIPKIINHAKKHDEILIYGDGSRLQNYISVEDAARIIMCSIEKMKKEVLLGVGEKSYSNKEIADIIAEILPNVRVNYVKEDKSPSFVYDATDTYKKLNFRPLKDIKAGLKQMINVI